MDAAVEPAALQVTRYIVTLADRLGESMGEQLTAALVAAAVSAVVSLAVALAQLRQGRQSQRSQIQADITGKYDGMVDYRLQQPCVLALARKWGSDCFAWIYDHSGPDGDARAIYYGYVELITFYCSAVLYARSHDLIDADLYESQHEPLIRLLLAEHYPIFSSIIRPSGYVSKYLVRHTHELRDSGWDWEDAFLQLAKWEGRRPNPGVQQTRLRLAADAETRWRSPAYRMVL